LQVATNTIYAFSTSHVDNAQCPSVDKTAEYWKEKGGTIRIAKETKPGTSNGEAELKSAFLELGCHAPSTIQHADKKDDKAPVCFALELVATDKKNFSLGNIISYI
jgi:hypothetical protein